MKSIYKYPRQSRKLYSCWPLKGAWRRALPREVYYSRQPEIHFGGALLVRRALQREVSVLCEKLRAGQQELCGIAPPASNLTTFDWSRGLPGKAVAKIGLATNRQDKLS